MTAHQSKPCRFAPKTHTPSTFNGSEHRRRILTWRIQAVHYPGTTRVQHTVSRSHSQTQTCGGMRDRQDECGVQAPQIGNAHWDARPVRRQRGEAGLAHPALDSIRARQHRSRHVWAQNAVLLANGATQVVTREKAGARTHIAFPAQTNLSTSVVIRAASTVAAVSDRFPGRHYHFAKATSLPKLQAHRRPHQPVLSQSTTHPSLACPSTHTHTHTHTHIHTHTHLAEITV